MSLKRRLWLKPLQILFIILYLLGGNKDVKVEIPTDIKEALPMLITLTNTMARYFGIPNAEILGVMAEYLLEEEE